MAGEPYKAVHQADHPNNEPGYVPPPFLAPAEEDEPTSGSKTEKLMARIKEEGPAWALAIFVMGIFLFGIWWLFYKPLWRPENPPPLPFFGERDYLLELDHSLTEDFEIDRIGQFIHVYCNTTETANNFCLDVKKQENSLMKVCADFTNATERGAHTLIEYKGKEGQTIKSYSLNPFGRNGTVDLRLRVLGKHVQVFGNLGEFGVFDKPSGFDGTLTATLKGDIRQVRLFRVVGDDQYNNPYERDLVFQEHNRLDITLQPLMTLTDISQISGIYGDGALTDQEQIASNANLTRVKRKSSSTSGRGGSSSRSSGSSSSGRSSTSYSSSSSSWGTSRSTSGYHYKKYYRQNYYIYKDRRVGGPVPIHPYSGPASYSYRANGMTYYTSTPNCPNGCETRPKIPMPKAKRIDVLFKDSEGIPTFTLSLRWEENAVVVNTYQKVWVFPNKWADDEIRIHPIPVEDWRLFDLSIVHDGSQLIIYFDGQRFMDFEHRDRSKVLEKVLIQGDCEILRVAKDGQPV